MTKEAILWGMPAAKDKEGNMWYTAAGVLIAMEQWAGQILGEYISDQASVTRTIEVPKHILDEYAKQESEKAFNAARMQAGFMALTPGSHIEIGYKHDTFEDYYSKK